jgi:hypothetical protein
MLMSGDGEDGTEALQEPSVAGYVVRPTAALGLFRSRLPCPGCKVVLGAMHDQYMVFCRLFDCPRLNKK